MVQCSRQAARNRRVAKCPNCKDVARNGGDEEEALLSDENADERTQHTNEVEERYRDEES